jgi:hypothetical protein
MRGWFSKVGRKFEGNEGAGTDSLPSGWTVLSMCHLLVTSPSSEGMVPWLLKISVVNVGGFVDKWTLSRLSPLKASPKGTNTCTIDSPRPSTCLSKTGGSMAAEVMGSP